MTLRTAALLCLALAGCAGADETVVTRPANACSVAAEQRMRDGALNGYYSKLQKFVYDHSYADCVRWNSAHGISY